MQNRRYLFLVPGVTAASGGVAVLYDVASFLTHQGHTVVVLHEGRGSAYADTPHRPDTCYTHALRAVRWRRSSHFGKVRQGLALLRELAQPRRNPRLELRPDDVLVVPEFLLDLAQEAFPDHSKVVFVQNPFSYVDACGAAIARGIDPQHAVIHSIGISRMCMDALAIAGAHPASCVPVSPDLGKFEFVADKRRQIAYMPRKRRREAQVLAEALRRRGRIADFALVEIDGMTHDEVARTLGGSLFFVSLMRLEALGFPAMEAMSAGCVAVGYTGIGTREYFDETTGIPVPEGDTAALVAAVESAVAEYDADPARLDALRRAGSERVNAQYARPLFEAALREAWQRIAAG